MTTTKSIDNINIYWKQIFHALKKSSKPILEELSLTKVDANILLALSRTQESTKAELAQYLSFEPNSLTRSLDRLIDINLVKRLVDQDDRRFIKLSLTDKGHTVANNYIEAMRNVWVDLFADLKASEIKQLESTLERIFLTLRTNG